MVYDEAKHVRGTGAQGGQFVAKAAGGGTFKANRIGFDGRRGAGYGVSGGDDNVKALQKALNRLGITDSSGKPLAVDGKFGPKTTAAVRRLQAKLKLPVDGKVTPALLKRIQGLKRKTSLVDPAAKKAAPKKAAKKAAPAKAAPPARKAAAPKTLPPRSTAGTARRSVGYSTAMTDFLARHGSHNQKSHGNRLGRPKNVAGKTGLSKATAALADKPEQGPAPAPKRRDLSTASARKAAVEEYQKLTKSQFDALPEDRKAEIIEELRQVVKDGEYDRGTTRGTAGTRVTGVAQHLTGAKFLISNFRRTLAPQADNSVKGRASRLKSATSASEARSILSMASIKDMDAIAEENGWLGGTSRGWKKEKWIAHLVGKATARSGT